MTNPTSGPAEEPAMPDLPTVTVTFLFTDVEGSTRLSEQQSAAMRTALLAAEGQTERALQPSGAVETLAAAMGYPPTGTVQGTLARWLEVARPLEERAATAAIAVGRALSHEEALAVALAERG